MESVHPSQVTMSRENVALTEDDDRYFKDAVGLGCALEAFAEAQEVREWVAALPRVAQDGYGLEGHRQQFVTVLDRYQEQPHLLDPHLPALLSDLLALVRGAGDDGVPGTQEERWRTAHAAAAFASHLVKVRKAKVVARHFPHEVADVEPVLALLEAQDPHSAEDWETRYVLLLWMSVLVLIPFDLARFDSGAEGRRPLAERVLGVVKTYLSVANKTQDAAAFLASKFITR